MKDDHGRRPERWRSRRCQVVRGPSTKLSVTLTMRERDLIRDETFCDPDFAKCAVVEDTGIRMELSLDEIEEIQGYMAAEANHTRHPKRRKEVDRLFAKLQMRTPLMTRASKRPGTWNGMEASWMKTS